MLSRLSPRLLWPLLFCLSLALALLLDHAGLPAALLMGPMATAIAFAAAGATLKLPALPYQGAQGVIGCLVARAVTPEIVHTVAADFPLFLAVVLVTLAASSLLGWAMSRWRVLPGSTAVWGSSPGGATAMMLMAEAFGADPRLVAFMQYLRIVFVALTAALISRFWIGTGGDAVATVWFPPVDGPALALTLLLAFGGAALARRLPIPAGGFLVPMVVGAVLHALGLLKIELPEWLLAASYALVGWKIGLGFTRAILRSASRALGHVVLSILALIAFCGAIAALLTQVLGIDPLTAYLATSPGGMDSIAIIASSSKADLSFVMALQTMRLIIVVLLGPAIARLVARHAPPHEAGQDA